MDGEPKKRGICIPLSVLPKQKGAHMTTFEKLSLLGREIMNESRELSNYCAGGFAELKLAKRYVDAISLLTEYAQKEIRRAEDQEKAKRS